MAQFLQGWQKNDVSIVKTRKNKENGEEEEKYCILVRYVSKNNE